MWSLLLFPHSREIVLWFLSGDVQSGKCVHRDKTTEQIFLWRSMENAGSYVEKSSRCVSASLRTCSKNEGVEWAHVRVQSEAESTSNTEVRRWLQHPELLLDGSERWVNVCPCSEGPGSQRKSLDYDSSATTQVTVYHKMFWFTKIIQQHMFSWNKCKRWLFSQMLFWKTFENQNFIPKETQSTARWEHFHSSGRDRPAWGHIGLLLQLQEKLQWIQWMKMMFF